MACGVLQSSVIGAILFLLCCGDLQLIIESHGLCPHLYADDSQIYGSCRPSAIPKLQTRISACIDDVRVDALEPSTAELVEDRVLMAGYKSSTPSTAVNPASSRR